MDSHRVRPRPLRSKTPPLLFAAPPPPPPPPPPKPKANKITIKLPTGGFVGLICRFCLDFFILLVVAPTPIVTAVVLLTFARVVVLLMGFLFPTAFPFAGGEFRTAAAFYRHIFEEVGAVVSSRVRIPFR